MEIGLVAALATGVLALLSPCSALLLPSFFAYAFASGRALVLRTAVFTLGLMAVLVPLGLGVQSVTSLFYGQRDLLVTVAGWLIVAFGILQLFGGGFALPLGRWRARATVMSGVGARGEGGLRSYAGTLLLGAVFGLAGFCSGPALGVILTMAATSPSSWGAGVLLAGYAVGMALPLFLLAMLWDRYDLGHRRWLRGRALSLGSWTIHTTALASGVLFIVVGVLFLVFDGTAGLVGTTGIDLTGTELTAQQWVVDTLGAIPWWVLAAAVAVVALAVSLAGSARRPAPGDQERSIPAEESRTADVEESAEPRP